MKEKKDEIKKKNDDIRLHNNRNRKNRMKILVLHENSYITYAVKAVDAFILHLKRGSANDRTEARLLELEREYIRKTQKNKLNKLILENVGGSGVGGEYTLGECGLALGITRQRAEQIEKEARRKMKHPGVGRHIKKAMYA